MGATPRSRQGCSKVTPEIPHILAPLKRPTAAPWGTGTLRGVGAESVELFSERELLHRGVSKVGEPVNLIRAPSVSFARAVGKFQFSEGAGAGAKVPADHCPARMPKLAALNRNIP